MKIKTVLDILKETFYLRSIIKRYGGSLVTGRYHLYDSFRAMSFEGSREMADLYLGSGFSSPRKVSVARALNRIGYYKNRNKKTTSEYEALYSANNFDKVREVKLFSFKSQKILILCVSQDEVEKQLDQYAAFSNAYGMPCVEKKDRYPNSFEISMVNIRLFPGDAEALNTILDCTVNFNSTIADLKWVSVKKLTEFSYDDPEMNSLLQWVAEQISPAILGQSLPLCMQHGDVSKENLMYGEAEGKTGFWWIDWEHAGDRAFFYDFFFYVVNSAMYYDTKALDCYMRGEMDEDLKRAFSHFGLEFDPFYRKDWILVFMVEFLKERVCDPGRVAALRNYCELIGERLKDK